MLSVCTFVLGLCFFPAYLDSSEKPPPSLAAAMTESVYRTLQLFFLGWETTSHPIPWQLEVARYLGACVALSAVLAALYELLRNRLELLKLRFYRNHVVVCGLGEGGVELVADLRGRGKRVVVVEAQENHPDLGTCRELGAIVLVGSPTDRWVLAQARVDRAATLLSLYLEDAESIESLMRAYELNKDRTRGKLRCTLLVFDHDLRGLLLREKLFRSPRCPIRLHLFNLYDIGAQVMLRESPAMYNQKEPRRLLLIGMGWLGQMLLERVVRAWQIDRLAGRTTEQLELVLVDQHADGLKARLARICPRSDGIREPVICQMDIQGEQFALGKYWPEEYARVRPDAVFVCLADDRLALLAAFRLHDRFGVDLPMVVRMTSRKGVAELFTPQSGKRVHVVGLNDLASTMHLVDNATTEMIAREIHRDYVLDRLADGETKETNSALVPWHELSAEYQESNRLSAAHLDTLLQAIACKKVPRRTIEELFKLEEEDEVKLAKLEHERWCEERRRGGWRFGPTRDPVNKLSPFLVPWDQLSDKTREDNRKSVRRIPIWLAKAGFTLEREGSET